MLLHEQSAAELLNLFSAGATTPSDVIDAVYSRIADVDPALNAVLLPLEETARAAAEESTRRWRDGNPRALEGVPYGLKDIIETAGLRTTGGSALFAEHVPSRDAVVAARLADAGGILVGKLHTFEFACGGAENRTIGICRNPWDLDRGTGGSSSGSAAAVASGEVTFALGTDTGGSVRIPAAYCGVVALKPTFGRVPRSGVMPLSWSLDHVGPMTRSVADAGLVLGVLAGADPRDPTSSRRSVPDYLEESAAPPGGARVGRLRGFFEEDVEPRVLEAFDRACRQFGDLGIEVVDVELSEARLWDAAAWCVIYAEMLSLHQQHVSDIENRDAMGAGMLAVGPFVDAVDYLRALRYRSVAQRQFTAAMAGLDALIAPTVTTVAPPLDTVSTSADSVRWLAAATRMSTPFNFTGVPALALPIGLVDDLPVSLQVVTRPHDEVTALRLGRFYESHTDSAKLRPPITASAR